MVMTIFRKIVEEFLIEGIEKIKAKSKSYDEGIINFARTTFGVFPRNTDLSGNKHARLDRLKTDIQALPEAVDSATKDALLGLLTHCNHDLLNICTGTIHKTGTTEILITALHAFVTAAYEKIYDDLKLTDVLANNKTINTFKYYAGKACGRSMYEKIFISMYEKQLILIKGLIKSEEMPALNIAKERIIFMTIGLAIKINNTSAAARTSKTSSVMNKEDFIQLMVERAEFIKREVQKIDQDASNEYVNDYMDQAINVFRPPVPKTEVIQAPNIEEPQKKDEEEHSSNLTLA